MNPSRVCGRVGVPQPYRAAASQPKEPPEININSSKEGSKYLPVDMEPYEIRAKDTIRFSQYL